MADLNSRLKKNKVMVLFTLCAFLSMIWFGSCSKLVGNDGTGQKKENGTAGKLSLEKGGKQLAAEKKGSKKQDEEGTPCGCPQSPDEDTESINQHSGGPSGAAEGVGGKRFLTQEERDQSFEQLDRYFVALEEAAEEIPADNYDPQAVVDLVGNDPGALFQWVRDNIRFVAYRGVLRGPFGTLMDRRGNSLDRALLLHEMLSLAGFEARLAQGNLSKEKAIELLGKNQASRQRAGLSQSDPLSEIDKFIKEHPDQNKTDSEALKKYVVQASRERENFSKELGERVTEQTNFIRGAIERYRAREKRDDLSTRVDEIRDHWWVQYNNEETWTDLDPASEQSAPGLAIVRPENTCQPDELEKELIHSINLKVVIEQWKGGSCEKKPILEYILNPFELFGKRVALHHLPMNWPEGFSFIGNENLIESLKSTVLKEKEWQPVLTVGSDRITQSSFTASGDVNESPGEKESRAGEADIVGGLFQATGGEEGKKESKKGDSILSAEWIEFIVHKPGSQDRTIRRQVFDLLGPAARKKAAIPRPNLTSLKQLERGLALLGETEILVQVCQISPEFAGHLMAESMLSNREIVKEILEPIESTEQLAERVDRLQELTPLPGPLYILAGARLSWSGLKDETYLSQPNIIDFIRKPSVDRDGNISVKSGFDIVSNEISFQPTFDKDLFQSRIYQGVLDTNAEALIMKSVGGAVENVAEIYAQSKGQKIDWMVLNDPSDKTMQELKTSDDMIARIRQDLQDNYIVIAPKQEIQIEGRGIYGWWRLDRDSGSILGSGPEGGQALAEYALKIAHRVSQLVCLAEFAHVKSAVHLFCRLFVCSLLFYQAHAMHVAWSLSMSLWRFAALNEALIEGLSHLCAKVDEKH